MTHRLGKPSSLRIEALIFLVLSASYGVSQVNVTGNLQIVGALSVSGSAKQYTHIWAFAPPPGGPDNTTFVADVMSQPYVDGVSLLVSWSSIEGSAPTTTPCGPTETPDLCQLDPMVPTYHRYTWTSFDSNISQWFTFGSSKMVNLLVTGAESGSLNPSTPAYVTGSDYISLFTTLFPTFDRQDVINFPQNSCSPWTGQAINGTNMTRTGGGLVDVTSWSGTPFAATDTVFIGGFLLANANWNTDPGGSAVTYVSPTEFKYQSSCNTGSCSALTTTGASGFIISAVQSWPVPYDYPFKSALKTFWAAAVAHYGPAYPNYSQLYYLRFGGSVGSEWFPYCTGNLTSLGPPYGYSQTAWTDYYKEMASYLQSLSPSFRVGWSINSAETPPVYSYANTEATAAVSHRNVFGVTNGFGSQGLSVNDYLQCNGNTCTCPDGSMNCSASNWYNNFKAPNNNTPVLELQQLSLSYPQDTMCTHPCQPGNFHYSGDLKTWLDFAWQSYATDVEIYWRDLELAFGDTGYCTLNGTADDCTSGISLDNQLTDTGEQAQFFQMVGRKPSCGGTQSGASGDCSYLFAIQRAHGQH